MVGSAIQSYWPCMTLWPISMLSMILLRPNIAVPANQNGGKMPPNSSARPPISRPRWALIILRM
jgi:hypothetical protein